MVEKSKPVAAAEKQESLAKRPAGMKLASWLFYDEGGYSIIDTINVLLLSLFAAIVISYCDMPSYCVILIF